MNKEAAASKIVCASISTIDVPSHQGSLSNVNAPVFDTSGVASPSTGGNASQSTARTPFPSTVSSVGECSIAVHDRLSISFVLRLKNKPPRHCL